MNTLESFIDLDSMTNAQSLDWSEMAATLEQSKAMYPTSEKLFQRVSNIGDFLIINWAVMSTQSKIPIYRKLRYIIEEAIPGTLEALLEQLPTTLSILKFLEVHKFLETNEDGDTWAIKIPRNLLVEAIDKVFEQSPQSRRLKSWRTTIFGSRMFVKWDDLDPATQLQAIKTLEQTDSSIAQVVQRNRASRRRKRLGALPTETELVPGIVSTSPAALKPRRRRRPIEPAPALTEDVTQRVSPTRRGEASGLPPSVFSGHSTSALAWTPVARRPSSPSSLSHSTTVPAAVQRSFEDLGPIQLPFATNENFDPSLIPPPPLPGNQLLNRQLDSSYRSPPHERYDNHFTYPPSLNNSVFDNSYSHESTPQIFSHGHHPLNLNSVRLGREFEVDHSAPENTSLEQDVSHRPRYDNFGFSYSQHIPSSSSHPSSVANLDHELSDNGEGGSQSFQHGYFEHPRPHVGPPGYFIPFDTFGRPQM